MSDSPEHNRMYAQFCGPRLEKIDKDLSNLHKEVQGVKDERAELSIAIERLRGRIENGLTSRVKSIDSLQRWQMGILAAIFLAIAGAMIAKVF